MAEPVPAVRARLSADELAVRVREREHDPVGLLVLCRLAEDRAAQTLRKRAFAILSEYKHTATHAELESLATQLARVLPQAARSPAEVREVLGAPAQIVRQMLYRRWLEQWHYDSPVPLCVVFDCPKGLDPSLRTVNLLVLNRL
jgi:hypothetical protein